jgi:predicted HAD superfamily Cof-like phosphohydrolase
MKTNQECVAEFTEAFKMFQTNYGDYSIELLKGNPKTSKLRYDLILEEYTELLDAFSEKNFIEIIDALTDILYVTYGAGVALGIDLDKSFPDIIKTMRRKDFDHSRTHFENVVGAYTLDEKTIKTNIFNEGRESELNSIMVFTNTLKRDIEILSKILIEFTEYEKLEETLNKINYKVYSIGVLLRINLDKSFKIVHDSNMSKVCKDKATAELTVEHYRKNETRYDTPTLYPLNDANGRYIVRNASSGKALKSIEYTPACFLSMTILDGSQ